MSIESAGSVDTSSALDKIIINMKTANERANTLLRTTVVMSIVIVGGMERMERQSIAKPRIKLPKVTKSAKGVEGEFSVKGYDYRVDTNKVAPGEGGFHIHIFRDGGEIAKVNGRGGFVKNHKGESLLKPSELNKTVRNELNQLIKYVQKTFGGE